MLNNQRRCVKGVKCLESILLLKYCAALKQPPKCEEVVVFSLVWCSLCHCVLQFLLDFLCNLLSLLFVQQLGEL